MAATAGKKSIYFCLQTPQEEMPFETIRDHWLEAERLGYDAGTLEDHMYPVAVNRNLPQLDCCMTLAALTQHVKRLRLGVLVFCNNYRNPALLAKMAATVDVLSNGRLDFYYGAGWQRPEYEAYGYVYGPAAERLAQMEEGIEVIKRAWHDEVANFSGRYYHIENLISYPKPIQKPHPPFGIGGKGEKITLRIVAKHADRWNFGGQVGASIEEFRRKIDILKGYCAEIGRDPNEIEVGWYGPVIMEEDRSRVNQRIERRAQTMGYDLEKFRQCIIGGTPDECIDRIHQYIEVGVTQFVVMFGRVDDFRGTRLFGEKVLPAFK